MSERDDRRRTPRADARLRVDLAHGPEGALSVETLNIGSGGVYVQVPRFIEPLTKLSLAMVIPAPTADEEPVRLETEAIVVRTLPEAPDPAVEAYEIACAFLELADETRDAINRYILTHGASTPV
ncbi:MAG: PilZ domain-containing protein [bacterium]